MNTTIFRFSGVAWLTFGVVCIFFFDRLTKSTSLAFLVAMGALNFTLAIPWIFSALRSFLRRQVSRKQCLRAFEKLSEWTYSTVIEPENLGYHKQMVEALDSALFRHLSNYPEDRTQRRIRWYQAYIKKSYRFGIKKW